MPVDACTEARGVATHVGAAEVAARRIRDHVGSPRRVGGKADAVLRLIGRDEVPALDVRLRLVVRGAVLVDHQRGVEPDGAQRLDRLRDALTELGGDIDPVLAQHVVGGGASLIVE